MLRLALFLLAASLALPAAPPAVIFDTDMGNDVDDALALAMLHSLESRGECHLLAVTLTNPASSAAPFVHLMNRFYGRGSIPVGASTAQRTDGAQRKYLDAALASAPDLWREDVMAKFPPAIPLLRRLLAASSEKVILVQVGFSENLAALLDSPADEYSKLTGVELVKQKVSLLSMMAGDFASDRPEYNVKVNVPVARQVIEHWPTPLILSGYEIGSVLKFPAASIERDFSYAPWHPVVEAYRAYMKMPYDRPTWDLTSVLVAVRPWGNYFDFSPPGVVTVDDAGRTTFHADAAGTRRYLVLPAAGRARALEALVMLASEPGGGGRR